MGKKKQYFSDYAKSRMNKRVVNDVMLKYDNYITENAAKQIKDKTIISVEASPQLSHVNVFNGKGDCFEIEFSVGVFFYYWCIDEKESRILIDDMINVDVVYSGTVNMKLEDFKLHSITPHDMWNSRVVKYSKTLVPYFPDDGLEKLAKQFLKKYYPSALEQPTCINVEKLVSNMGLKLKNEKLKNGVFGQIYFLGDKKGEIVVDPTSRRNKTKGSLNNTIVHECVHWEFHRKIYEFANLLDPGIEKIECDIKEHPVSSETYQIETQANSLAPKILMPIKTLEQFYKQTVINEKEKNPEKPFCDIYVDVVKCVAETFGVSLYSANLRLKKLGYCDGFRAFEYIDRHYVRPYAFKKNYLKEHQTFTIPILDAFLFFYTLNKDIDYLFVENHVIKNDTKYYYKENNELRLTDYARMNLHECALVFKHMFYNLSPSKSFVGLLNKSFNVKKDFYYLRDENEITKLSSATSDILKQLPHDFSEAYKKTLELTGRTRASISQEIDKDPKTVGNILLGRTKGELPTIVQMCWALHLPYDVTEYLMELSGYNLRATDDTEALYRSILQYWWQWDIRKAKKQLNNNGIHSIF